MTALRFGVVTGQGNTTWPDLLALWQEIDSASNYDNIWLVDHFVPGMGTEAAGADGPHFEGWTALAALAQATSRARIGILVTGNTYRNPSVLAKMATTVDHISGGRLILGLGAAWHEFEHRTFGLPFYTTRERLERLEEAAQVIKLLWTQDRPEFGGRFYTLDRPFVNPPNIQTPHPPLLIGGGGEKRTLRTVARYADMCNISGSPDTIRHKVEVLRRHCDEAGRDPAEITVTAQALLFLNEDPAFQERVVQGFKAFRDVDEDEARGSVLLGGVEQISESVAAFAAAGVQELYVGQFPRLHRQSLLRFSAEIIPAFR